jgi:peptidoglycan hydrolase-like amidase
MIDSKDKPNKFFQSKIFWFISLFTFASCLPLVLVKTLSAPSTATKPQTLLLNTANRLPTLTVANPPANNPKSVTTTPAPQIYTPIVPKPPESVKTPKFTKNQPNQTKSPESTKTTTAVTKSKTENKKKTTSKTKTQAKPNPKQNKTPAVISPVIEVSVAIETEVTSLTIGTSTKAAITDEKGRVLQNINANQGLVARVDSNGIKVDNWQLPAVTWIQPQQGGAVYIGDKWFRGKLLLVAKEGKLLAINHVDLEHYLYSVVGSEMHPTANMDALKAQAVAARSYALVHIIRPASRWYNLGDNQRWQVYKGVGTEYNTTQQAVNETNNKILSLQGGVVESLYASTDEIVNRVHGGSGMSQTGAYKLADAGYNYQQILSYYYPGVELATLVRK